MKLSTLNTRIAKSNNKNGSTPNNNEKENWQIKANSLVQMVSKNDFSLGWKEIYTLIRNY